MHRIVAKSTLTLVFAAVVLTGCSGSDSKDAPTKTSTPAPHSASTPATSPASTPESPSTTKPAGTPTSATDLIGDWADPKADWTVHFKKDGTYVEDFEGNVDFQHGTYKIKGTTVSLVGGDGYTNKGAVKGDALKFRLGTLRRVS